MIEIATATSQNLFQEAWAVEVEQLLIADQRAVQVGHAETTTDTVPDVVGVTRQVQRQYARGDSCLFRYGRDQPGLRLEGVGRLQEQRKQEEEREKLRHRSPPIRKQASLATHPEDVKSSVPCAKPRRRT